ncbi:MAG: 50S ribosomal protein L4, partial [Candidatus Bathyarchaeia archaeon]
DDSVQSLSKAKDVRATLEKLGVWADILRVERNERSKTGKARLRGRAHRVGRGPLIVVDEDKGIVKAARNIPGVDVVKADDLNVEDLAPGAQPGRLTVWDSSTFASLDRRFLGET